MSLVAWYKLNGDTLDSSGNNRHLYPYNQASSIVQSSSGKIGQCYERTVKTSEYLATTENIDLTGSFTMATWAFVTVTEASANGLVTNHNHNTNYGAGITVRQISSTDFRISCNTGSGTGRTYNEYYGTSNIYNKWSHLVMRYDDNIKQITLWVDGIKEHTVTYTMKCAPDKIALFAWSTGYLDSSSYRPLCKLDDVRVYNHALSDKEIKELSKALVGHWTFDDFQEYTINYAQYTITAYTPYYTYSRDGNTHTCYRQSGSTSQTVALQCSTFTSAVTTGTIYTISGYLYLNDVPFKTTVPCISTYHTNTLNKITRDDGYFEYTQTFSTSGWIIHSDLCSALIGDTIKLVNLQIEIKDHATPFTEGTRDGKAYDSSGYNNHTMLDANCPQWIPDSKIGSGCYKFNGTNNYMGIENFVPGTTSLTISSWFNKIGEGSNYECVLHKGPDNSIGSTEYWLGVDLNDYLTATIGAVTGVGWSAGQTPVTATLGTWYHLAASWDGAVVKVYINGEYIKQYSLTSYSGSVAPMRFGSSSNGMNYQFNGIVDDVRIYATALSADDIKELYQQRASLDDKGNLFVRKIHELENIAQETNNAIINRLFTNGLSSYTQSNCQVSLTTRGYRIYRPPNLIYPDCGNTVWGGLKVNLFNIDPNILQKGCKYRISFIIEGQSSNGIGAMYFSNQMGWGGGGLTSVSASKYSTLPSNFQGRKEIYATFNITDDIWKVCTTTYSVFVAGTSYNCYRDLCWGFQYTSTGSLGTDLYVTNFKIQDITDGEPINLKETGTMNMLDISEVGIIDGLVGWWPLNGDAKDRSGNLNHGTENNITYTSGPEGQCSIFNGANGWINTGYKPQFDTISFCVWINLDDALSGSFHICTIGDNDFNPQILMDIKKLRFYCDGASLDGNTVLTVGQWYYVCFVIKNINATQLNCAMYINGQLDKQQDLTVKINDRIYPNPLAIGQDWDGSTPTDFFKGKMYDFRLYNRELIPEEINTMYELTSGSTNRMKFTSDGRVLIKGQISEVI